MAGEWREIPFSQAVTVNPPVQLRRGATYPFVDMGAIRPGWRSVHARAYRQFSGGGSRFVVGDTLMARITPCLENGKIARFVGQPGEIAHGSTEFIVIRGREGISDTDYAYYLTKWERVRGYAISQMTGTSGRQRVPAEAFDHLSVPLPPLSEQRAIAHILGTLDDKIELNQRMSDTLEAMARALFKSWFVDFDPVRAKAEGRDPGLPIHIADLFPDSFEKSELGEIPKGWKVGTLGDIVEHVRNNENPSDSPEQLFRHYSIPAFDEGQWPVTEPGAAIKSQKTRVPPGALLISKLNPDIERVWLVDVEQGERAVCSTEFLVLKPRPPYGRAYAYCLMRSSGFRRELQTLVTGTSKSHQRARVDAVLELSVVEPRTAVAETFEQVASPLLARALECRRESHAAAGLRDRLLPKLMSGELRIENPERFLERVSR